MTAGGLIRVSQRASRRNPPSNDPEEPPIESFATTDLPPMCRKHLPKLPTRVEVAVTLVRMNTQTKVEQLPQWWKEAGIGDDQLAPRE